MSFPRHGGEFRLKFGLGEMHSIANFARNFAQRKNAQHSKFRNEFRETPALPKLSRPERDEEISHDDVDNNLSEMISIVGRLSSGGASCFVQLSVR